MSQEGTTQGDPLAMQFYALGTKPLISLLRQRVQEVSQVWLADDVTGAGSLVDLKRWWDLVIEEGEKLGYIVNEKKSWVIVKHPADLETALSIFEGSEIRCTTAGQRHLGAAIGSTDFKVEYFTEKVETWCEEVRRLSEFAKSQPHAAFSAYIHGQQHKYRYFMRTIKDISGCFKPLDDIINDTFLPTVLGFNIVNAAERELLSLPIKKGGMGIDLLADISDTEFDRSVEVTAPLAAIIAMQGEEMPSQELVDNAKSRIRAQKVENCKAKTTRIDSEVESATLRVIEQVREPGASNWLSALPLARHNLNLNKGEFHDACALRYNKRISDLPSHCVCGESFTVTHAMNCKRGGFISARHDNIRDFEAALLSQVCTDVEIEPQLQSLSNEALPRSANTSAEARLDVRTRGFWRRGQNSYFDIRVTNASAASQINSTLTSILKKHETEKKREYNARVMQVESGTFTPLVFTTVGSMGPETTLYHKAIAEKIAEKKGERYSEVISYIRTILSSLSVKSALLCLRGSRSSGKKVDAEREDYTIMNHELLG